MAIENLPSHLDPNDPMVKKAHQGKGWGAQDQKRYDTLIGSRKTGSQVRDMRGGNNFREAHSELHDHVKSGGTLGVNAQKQYDRMGNRIQKIDARQAAKQKAQAAQGSTGQAQNPIDKTVTGESDSAPKNEYIRANTTEIKNTQEQNINQDNDIDTTVNGNNNTVINEQDNSIRQYGGDNRSFVYNSNGGSAGTDTPATMATLAGFYAPDDSPAAQARFNDLYTTMNRDNQKRYAGDAMKTFAKYGNIDARSYTDESMENTINRGIQYSFDRADRQTGHVFGDIWNDNYITEDWKMPSAPAPIESNAEEIADKAKKDIEDL